MFNKLKRISYIFIVFILVFNSCSAISGVDKKEKNEIISKVISYSLEKFHYSGKNFDDKTSEAIFDELINRLDYNKRFFYKNDIENFEFAT